MDYLLKNEELFNFFDVEEARRILAFSADDQQAVFHYSRNYQLEYLGEMAERWEERKVIKTKKDVTTLIVGMIVSHSGQLRREQAIAFAENMSNYLLKDDNWNLTSAIALIRFCYDKGVPDNQVPILDKLKRKAFLEDKTEIKDNNEIIFILGCLSRFSRELPEEEISFALKHLKNLDFSLNDVDKEYPLVLLLSSVYVALDKPKVSVFKNFKTKKLKNILTTIFNLRNRELNDNQLAKAAELLGISDKDIILLNYILGIQYKDYKFNKITGPGEDRIEENYLKLNISSEEVFAEVFKEKLEWKHRRYILKHLDKVVNFENMKYIFENFEKSEVENNINSTYVEVIKNKEVGFVSKEFKRSIIKTILESSNSKKEDFLFLEHQRQLLDIKIDPSRTYVQQSFDCGLISLNNVEEIESKGLTKEVEEFLWRKSNYKNYLDFLIKIDEKYYERMAERYYFQDLKSLVKNFEEKEKDFYLKNLFEIRLKAIFRFKPELYTQTVYSLLQNEDFIKFFEYSSEEIEKIEKLLFEKDLLEAREKEEVRKRYTPKEELEKERIEKLKENLENRCHDRYDIESWGRKNAIDMKNHSSLRLTFINKILQMSLRRESDLENILFLFYKLKVQEVFEQEQVEQLEEHICKKIKETISA